MAGAKSCFRPSAEDSSITESLPSYGVDDDPLPVAAQMSPEASTSGAAPPIQTAPWVPEGVVL